MEKIELIKAEKVREITEKAVIQYNKYNTWIQYVDICQKIKKSSEHGDYEVEFDDYIDKESIIKLKEAGYKVSLNKRKVRW